MNEKPNKNYENSPFKNVCAYLEANSIDPSLVMITDLDVNGYYKARLDEAGNLIRTPDGGIARDWTEWPSVKIAVGVIDIMKPWEIDVPETEKKDEEES